MKKTAVSTSLKGRVLFEISDRSVEREFGTIYYEI